MSSADATVIATNGNGNGNPLAVFWKNGPYVAIIGILLFFLWTNNNNVVNVVEKNTEALIEWKGAVGQMKDALRDNTSAINEMRKERNERRPR